MCKFGAYLVTVSTLGCAASYNILRKVLLLFEAAGTKPIVLFCSKEHALVVDTFGSAALSLVLCLRESFKGAFEISFTEFFLTQPVIATHFGAQNAVVHGFNKLVQHRNLLDVIN